MLSISVSSYTTEKLFIHGLKVMKRVSYVCTVQCKILTGENIDEFDEFPTIHQYFSYQSFPFS